ncbi:MAG: beta-N-acetylhexosaminidase [Croceivirga sp.]
MKKFIKIATITVLLLLLGATVVWFGFLKPTPPAISEEDRSKITLMPLPAELTVDDGYFSIDSGFGYMMKGVSSPKIERALNRFFSKLSSSTGMDITKKSGNALTIDCKSVSSTYPSLSDDESYSLKVRRSEIVLSANSETGVLHGLESLLQLTSKNDNGWTIPKMDLKDHPRYPWRGIMMDIARHWIPKDVILRNLEAMAAVKMNVLHLHLTEYQGFRIESKKFPKLHELGSDGDYLSQEDIKEIVSFAADRGIRVVPEFDVPGHSTSWFVGHPELASAPGPYTLDSIFGILTPVMNPISETTYKFLDTFFEEMATLFPDEYLHIGGDEVKPLQWEENEAITAFMEDNSIEDFHELQAYFNIQIQKILKKHHKKMLGWDEIIHPNLPKEGIAVQSWRSQKSLWDAAKSGNRAILSNGYYLDYKQSAGAHYQIDPMVIPSAITIDIDSLHWKSWKSTLNIQGTDMPGELYLFGKGENPKGVVRFMDNALSFTNATLRDDGTLTFSMDTSFGEVEYDLKMKGDSLNGNAKLAIFDMVFAGKRTGGSDMPNGIDLPKFEKIEPLTPDQAQLILGGEACMWTEMADKRTIESRIWPRAAAVAEKLWSPKDLTSNVDDMYRRLFSINKILEERGLRHQSNNEALLQELVPKEYQAPIKVLAEVLEEDKFFNRSTIYNSEFYTYTPLNRMVDAVHPESYKAYHFNSDVAHFLKTEDVVIKKQLKNQLMIWEKNHSNLLPVFNVNKKMAEGIDMVYLGTQAERIEQLKEIEPHSKHLSKLAFIALKTIDGKRDYIDEHEMDSLLNTAYKAHGGTLMPVVNGIQNLIEYHQK